MSTQANSKSVLADALGLAVADIDETTALYSTAEWNSLAHLRLILAIEEKLSKRLSPQEIVGLVDLKSVDRLLENQG